MTHSAGLLPVANGSARILILGTLPGQMSLRMQQYYAQPRNAFWKLMGELLGAGPDLPYPERLQRLLDAGVALWDVCEAATRPGSLDASINDATVVANNFDHFFGANPSVRSVYFNGAKAEALYRRLVLPSLHVGGDLSYLTLPSTSPAHAAMSFKDKLAKWSVVAAQ